MLNNVEWNGRVRCGVEVATCLGEHKSNGFNLIIRRQHFNIPTLGRVFTLSQAKRTRTLLL